MDIIDFVQNVCGWQLSEWQIKFTRAAYDAIANVKVFEEIINLGLVERNRSYFFVIFTKKRRKL